MNNIYWLSVRVAKHRPLHNLFPLAIYTVITRQIQEIIDEGTASLFLRKKK
jgi:hypothetical protein